MIWSVCYQDSCIYAHLPHPSCLHNVGHLVEISHDSISGKLSCSCGNDSHARFSYNNIYSLCHRTHHSTDPNVFPDQVDGSLVAEIPTGITNDAASIDYKPLIIDRPPFPDLTTSEDDAGY